MVRKITYMGSKNPWRERIHFSMPGDVLDVVTHANLCQDWLRGFGVEFSILTSFTLKHIAWSVITHIRSMRICQQNPRVLWQTVNTMLHPPRQHDTCKLSAADFASFFQSKVANIRTATASAKPPVIDPRQAPSLSQFQPATVEEITRLINTMPARQVLLTGHYSFMALETSDTTHSTRHLITVQSLTTQWWIPPWRSRNA